MRAIKKILFVGFYPNEKEPYLRSFFRELICGMADLGMECTVIAPVSVTHYGREILEIPRLDEDITRKGNRIRVFHPRYVSFSSVSIGKFNTEHFSERVFEDAAWKQVRALNESFDCVYGHFFLYGGLAAVRIGRALDIPAFLAYGECDFESQVYRTYGMPAKKQLSGLSGIVSVSTKNTKELNALGIVPGVPILTEPNAVDETLFFKQDRAACRQKLGIPLEPFVVGFVGGFIERKGDKRLLKAAQPLEDVFLAFAGKGDDPPGGERVLFCKPLRHEDVCTFLNAIDVFCLPTLSEGSCNAVAEAMACGCAIISSRLPFNDDVLTDRNSIRIDPSSVEEIREAILLLKENRSLREALSEQALIDSHSHTISNRARSILGFLKECGEQYDNQQR